MRKQVNFVIIPMYEQKLAFLMLCSCQKDVLAMDEYKRSEENINGEVFTNDGKISGDERRI